MVEKLKKYINTLIADSTENPDAALNFRGQAYWALMFIFDNQLVTEDEKTDLCNFWDDAWATFADIYNDYMRG